MFSLYVLANVSSVPVALETSGWRLNVWQQEKGTGFASFSTWRGLDARHGQDPSGHVLPHESTRQYPGDTDATVSPVVESKAVYESETLLT